MIKISTISKFAEKDGLVNRSANKERVINNDMDINKDVAKAMCKSKLKKLVNKKELFFTKRCNKSIDIAMHIAIKKLNSEDEKFLLIQEEGGWMTYKDYVKKLGMTLILLEMSEGKILKKSLEDAIHKSKGNAILILHSLPGYSYEEDVAKIREVVVANTKKELKADAKKDNFVLINDCCGSIGTKSAQIGDIIVCSFGEAKPLSIGKEGAAGGFISSDEFESTSTLSLEEQEAEDIIDFKRLNVAIDGLQKRREFWIKKADKVKKELIKKGFNILNSKEEGFNVLVAFFDEKEKERLINYCKENKIEYTECPRYIRTNKKALSLEIKRCKDN